jgi:hypothetical protein
MNTNTDCLSPSVEAASGDPLVRLLADYLLASPGAGWPGTDGQTVGGVVAAAYPAAVAAGAVPGPAELTRRHADLADLIAAYFGPAK